MPKKSSKSQRSNGRRGAPKSPGARTKKKGVKKKSSRGKSRTGSGKSATGTRRPKRRGRTPIRKNLDDGIRLQKLLATAGHGSRRECEELIAEGRVTVDGKVVQVLGTRVDPEKAKIAVDGVKVISIRKQYFMVNKPTGVLSTCSDPEGRIRVIDLIKTDQRVYNVGRLDKSSEGLMLVTNDGELANRLTHPRYGVQKTYMVTVVGNPKWEDLQQLKRGVRLAEAVARVSDIQIKKRRRDGCDLELVLSEGRNREIRRLLAHIGHKVTRLRRVAIGPLQLGDLSPGQHRRLEPHEVAALKEASSKVTGKARAEKPIETSQLKGRRRSTSATSTKKKVTKKSASKKSASKKGGFKKKSKSKKKKRASVATGGSRRGAGRSAAKKPKTRAGGKKRGKGKRR